MENQYNSLLQKQRNYFKTGITRSKKFRLEQLNILKTAIKNHEANITNALRADLNKAWQETYMTEIGPALAELRFIKNHLSEWMKPQHVPGMLYSFFSSGKIIAEPHGTVLIIAPWNYPFYLSIDPIIGAIAAGNCVILKPSEHAPNTSAALKKMLEDNFTEEFIAIVEGDANASEALIDLPADYIFFTGSTSIGKIVAQQAAKNLVPVTLELGGKSPCVIDETADLKLAARRIVWGKIINAGQTCVAPDYILIHQKIKDAFIFEMKMRLQNTFPDGAINDADYPCIINERNYERIKTLMSDGKILLGGKMDEAKRKIEPTLFDQVNWNHRIMKEEIFGPLLPVFTFDSVNEVIETINTKPKPLSMYIFSSNKKFQQQLLNEVSFGGASVNDTIEHLGNHYLPFGGVGSSGIGAYHGKFSFDTFTHYKAVMIKSTWIDLNIRYKPLTKFKEMVLRMFLR